MKSKLYYISKLKVMEIILFFIVLIVVLTVLNKNTVETDDSVLDDEEYMNQVMSSDSGE